MLDLTQCYEREFEFPTGEKEQPVIHISEADNPNVSKKARTHFYIFLRAYLKQESPAAAYALGLFYRYRRPCGDWLLRTLEYWTFAAERGDWRAAFFLFQLYNYGENCGVEPDPERAFAWLLKSYENNPHAETGNILARRYLTGDGTDRDPQKARACYAAGAREGDAFAAEQLKSLTQALDNPAMNTDSEAVEDYCREQLFRSCGIKFKDE